MTNVPFIQSVPAAIAAGTVSGNDSIRHLYGDVLRREVELMRHVTESVRFLVIHCSATRCTQDYTAEQLERDHRARGFRTTGYHFYIRRDGTMSHARMLGEVGAHARGFNNCSIGICYEGGLDAQGNPCDTRTPQQKERLLDLLSVLKQIYPHALVVGHYQLSLQIHKACPCFDARLEYSPERIPRY